MAKKIKEKKDIIEQAKEFDNFTDEKIKDIVEENQPKIVNRPKRVKPQTKADMKDGFVRYNPNRQKGLTNAQVDERMFNGLVNQTVVKNKKTITGIIFSNLFTYFNILSYGIFRNNDISISYFFFRPYTIRK